MGDGGTVLHFDGSNWLPLAVPVTSAFRAIYGTAAQNATWWATTASTRSALACKPLAL